MMKIILTLLSSLFFCVSNAFADQRATTHLIGLLNNINSMNANFTQKIHHAKNGVGVGQPTLGTMVLEKPGKFRWNIAQPARQVIIADGKNLWIYNIDLQQVTVESVKNNTENSPAALLSRSPQDFIQHYQITETPQQAGTVFALKAKTDQEYFNTIHLLFIRDGLTQMNVADKYGQQSSITFDHIHINPPVSEQWFHFVVPKGVDVIRRS
jgi:outer membrane lipoprotein carrier protein